MSAKHQENNTSANREYEKTGLYIKNGKSFRVLALLGVIVAVIISLAGIAAAIDWLIDY
jgi:hypothetical protein